MTAFEPALGGERQVPVPDAVAREYLLLALRLDQHVPGLVDAYYGPASLKATVDMEQVRAPARLVEDASALREAIERDVPEADRRGWLLAQVTALETQAAALAGSALAYEDHVERCFGWRPRRRDEAGFEAAAQHLEALVPGEGTLAERLAAWDELFIVPVGRLREVIDWLVGRIRAAAEPLFGLPEGESLRVSLVTGQPWSGYNWYDGGLRSRVDVNTDLPIAAANLVHTIAHETYPGHHLEHAWKEASLVTQRGRVEASIQLINTPECLISEGLADLGIDFAAPPAEQPALLAELYERAGLPVADDPAAARELADRQVGITAARQVLAAVVVNAALMRHADGTSAEATEAYLRDVGRSAPDRAAKRLEFIDHPLWRTYVFVYSEGEALLRRWLEVVQAAERAGRFGRLLREQLTPAAITTELGERGEAPNRAESRDHEEAPDRAEAAGPA